MKRIALFLLTNIAILLVLSLVLRLLGVDRILDESGSGLNYNSLLVFSAVIGFGGAFMSLAMSKWMAKRSTGAQVITQPRNATEQWLLTTVAAQAKAAGIGMPEVAIFESPEVNAFATGATRNSSLVAVSRHTCRMSWWRLASTIMRRNCLCHIRHWLSVSSVCATPADLSPDRRCRLLCGCCFYPRQPPTQTAASAGTLL
jgi:hypothetical protein